MRVAVTALGAVAATLIAASVGAQSPEPGRPWPTGDALRRDLQDIGFIFRIDGPTGDWLGWPPLAVASDAPALDLDGAGTDAAVAGFDLALIGADPSLALTAFFEVATRLPLDPTDVEGVRRFVVEDLLQTPPETLEGCYATDWDRGAALITVDSETTIARLMVAETVDDLDTAELLDCASLIPSEVAAALGDPSSERVSITLGGDPLAFDPPDVELEGALVTVVLTFRNESDVEQSLTFAEPLESSTGPVDAGATRLIVVRQLEPGTYPFVSDADPDVLRGSLEIEAPLEE
jgi:hypothetical protein